MAESETRALSGLLLAQTMKLVTVLLLAGVVLCGCARKYTITTNSGGQIAARGKPRMENGYCVYKDTQGRRQTVPAGRVREIAPSSMVTSPRDTYPGAGSR